MKIGEIVQESLIQEDLKKNLATAALAGTLATAPVDSQAHEVPGMYDELPIPTMNEPAKFLGIPAYDMRKQMGFLTKSRLNQGFSLNQLLRPHAFDGLSKKELKDTVKRLKKLKKYIWNINTRNDLGYRKDGYVLQGAGKVKDPEGLKNPLTGKKRTEPKYQMQHGDIPIDEFIQLVDDHISRIDIALKDPNYVSYTPKPKTKRETNFEIKGIHLGMYPIEVMKIVDPSSPVENPRWTDVTSAAKASGFTILGLPVKFNTYSHSAPATARFGYGNDRHPLAIITVSTGRNSDSVLEFLNGKYGKGKMSVTDPNSTVYRATRYRTMRAVKYFWNIPEVMIRLDTTLNELTIISDMGDWAQSRHDDAVKQADVDSRKDDY